MICRLHDIARASFDFQEPGPQPGGLAFLARPQQGMASFLWPWVGYAWLLHGMVFGLVKMVTSSWLISWHGLSVSWLERLMFLKRLAEVWCHHYRDLDWLAGAMLVPLSSIVHGWIFTKMPFWCWGIQVKMEESSQNSEPAGILDQEWQRAHHWWSPQGAVQGSIHRQLAIKSNFKCWFLDVRACSTENAADYSGWLIRMFMVCPSVLPEQVRPLMDFSYSEDGFSSKRWETIRWAVLGATISLDFAGIIRYIHVIYPLVN